MEQTMQAKTPVERQNPMAEHRQMMQEQMVAMHDMIGPGGMMGKDQGAGTMDPNAQTQMMQRRMDMMQQHLMANPAQ